MTVKWTDEQKKVIDLRKRNILVSAAAGSGKTAVLVERILQLISEGEHPLNVDELLVVTFTRAAAAQMKDRLIRALEEKLETDPDNAHLQKQTTLIHHAQITTIDGFCSYVIRSYFQQIDLDPGARVADEGEQKLLLQDVLEQTLEEAYEAQDPDFLALAGALDSGKSDEGLAAAVEKLYTLSQSHPWPKVWLASCLEPYEAQDTEALENMPWLKKVEELTKALLMEAMEANARALSLALSEHGPQQYVPALESDRDYMEQIESATGYEALRTLLLGYKPKALSGKKAADVQEEKKLQVQKERARTKEILQEKLARAYYSDPLETVLEKMHQSLPVIRGLVRLTGQFADAFAAAKREKNLLDFNDVEHMALEVLLKRQADGTEQPTDAAKELSNRYAQIMIDEYQDSNLVQEKILTAVSRERRGEHNLFMVGDVKQSIYKFRLARPELFLEKYETYSLTDGDCQRIDLHKNFRSRKEVIDSVNSLFSRIMTKALGGIAYDPSVYLYPGAVWPKAETDCATELLLIEKDTEDAKELGSARELEAALAADRIRRMVGQTWITDEKTGERRRVRYGDIVILLRSIRGWSEVFSRVLKERKIPSVSISRVGYFSAPEVVTVLQYLRLLDNPRQEMPLTAVLTSAIGQLSPEDMAKIRNSAPKEALYIPARTYPDSRQADPVLADKLRSFWTLYDNLRGKTSYTSVRELLVELYEASGYLEWVSAMPAGEQRRANLLMLVEKAGEYEKSSYSGLFHFLRYIDSLQKYQVDFGEANVAEKDTDMVRIMSIHNSKGLEFPVVIVAGLGKSFNMTDTRQMVTLHPELGIGMPCIHADLRLREETLYHKVLQNILREETLGEELRVLYVALTRAKQKLILTGTVASVDKKLTEIMQSVKEKEEALPYGRLLFATSYMDWILQALGGSPALADLAESRGIQGRTEYVEHTLPDGHFEIRLMEVEDLVVSEMTRQLQQKARFEEIVALDTEQTYDENTRKYLNNVLAYTYPYQSYADMPSKLSVSELKLKAYEEEQGHSLYEEPEVIPYIPAFMQGSRQTASQGALRGTAYHRMMECIDYEAYADGVDMETQIARLTRKGMLGAEDAAMLRPEDFTGFMESALGHEMAEASRKGNLYRERQFFLTVPAGEADERFAGSDETILVQGIIDAYFETEEGLVLVDYKTDRVLRPDGQDLIEKYRVQLKYYARALTRLTGKPVVRQLIYSFALQDVLPV